MKKNQIKLEIENELRNFLANQFKLVEIYQPTKNSMTRCYLFEMELMEGGPICIAIEKRKHNDSIKIIDSFCK